MSAAGNDKIIEYFSHNVLYLRKRHNITKEKMAEILGIGIKTLNKIESGLLPPRMSVDVLFRIQEYFGIPPSVQVSLPIGEKCIKKQCN